MTVQLKTPEEIEKMREAGRLAAEVLQVVAPHVKPGVTTAELDRICHDHIVNVQQAIPANVGYRGFPATVCTSVNNVICHGIPSEGKVLKDGDIITAVDGQKLGSDTTLRSILMDHKVGDTVKLDVLRDGKTLTLDVTLAPRPENP